MFHMQLWPASPSPPLLELSAESRVQCSDRCLGLRCEGLLCFSCPRISDREKTQPRASAITQHTTAAWRKMSGGKKAQLQTGFRATKKQQRCSLLPSFLPLLLLCLLHLRKTPPRLQTTPPVGVGLCPLSSTHSNTWKVQHSVAFARLKLLPYHYASLAHSAEGSVFFSPSKLM